MIYDFEYKHSLYSHHQYYFEEFCRKYNAPIDKLEELISESFKSIEKEIYRAYQEYFESEKEDIRLEARESGYEDGLSDGRDEGEKATEELLIEKYNFGYRAGKQKGILESTEYALDKLITKEKAIEFVGISFRIGYERGHKIGTNWIESEYGKLSDTMPETSSIYEDIESIRKKIITEELSDFPRKDYIPF